MMRRKWNHRRGGVLILVLTCMAVVVALIGVMTQFALRNRRATLSELQAAQVEYLCEAGVQRAVYQLRRDANYDGEKWSPAMESTRFERPTIEIRIRHRDPANAVAQVTVVATLPQRDASHSSMQRSHTFVMDLSNPSTSTSTSINSFNTSTSEEQS